MKNQFIIHIQIYLFTIMGIAELLILLIVSQGEGRREIVYIMGGREGKIYILWENTAEFEILGRLMHIS